jgi:hypothetical protein
VAGWILEEAHRTRENIGCRLLLALHDGGIEERSGF